jgi:hypothetical protein
MLQKRTTLRIGSLWFDEPTPSIETFLIEELGAEEFLVGLLQTGPLAGQEVARGWLAMTCRRSFLLWEAAGGVLHVEELARAAAWRVQTGWGRDRFFVGERELFSGPLVAGKRLRQLFELGAKEPVERLVAAAQEHQSAGVCDWTDGASTEAMAVCEAYLEAASQAEEEGDFEQAVELYVGALRWQVRRLEAYEALARLTWSVSRARRHQIKTAKSVLELVDPQTAGEIFGNSACGVLSVGTPATRLATIDDEAHDTRLVHPDEHDRKVALHRLTARWACGERDDDALRAHCERADAQAYPKLHARLERVATLLGIPAPPVHLSRQEAGACALGRGKRPFILLAKSHLEEGSPRQLTDAQLDFVLASQVEHIRAGHLLFTHAEYVQGVRERGVELVLMAGEWLGARGLLGAKKTKAIKLAKPAWGARHAAGSEWLALTRDAAKAESTALARWGRTRALHCDDDEACEHSLVRRELAKFSRIARYTADRAGLLACGSLHAAVDAMRLLEPEINEPSSEEKRARVDALIRFALSEDYFDLRCSVEAGA